MKSIVSDLGPVPFPEFRQERFYMVPFLKRDGLPAALARYQPTVDAMLAGVDTDEALAITVDSRVVESGRSHRSPGPHIDGYWEWGRGHVNAAGGDWRQGGGGWGKVRRHEPLTRLQVLALQGQMIAHGRPAPLDPSNWEGPQDFSSPAALILAQSRFGSQAWEGELPEGVRFGLGGAVDREALAGLHPVPLLGGRAYAGNVTMVHESLPSTTSAERCLVRIYAPGWSPTAH